MRNISDTDTGVAEFPNNCHPLSCMIAAWKVYPIYLNCSRNLRLNRVHLKCTITKIGRFIFTFLNKIMNSFYLMMHLGTNSMHDFIFLTQAFKTIAEHHLSI